MAKSMLKELATDPRHYAGWILTTGIIILIFHALGVHGLHMPWYRSIILFLVVMWVDIIKHLVKLQ